MLNPLCRLTRAASAVFLLLAAPVEADEKGPEPQVPTLKIASMEIPYAYYEAGNGVYNSVFDQLVEGYSGSIDVTFYPSARYNKVMIERTADCDYIAIDKLDRWQDQGIAPDELEFIGPINRLSVVLYIPVNTPDVTEVETIRSMAIASDVNLLPTIHKHGIQEAFALQSQTQMLNLVALGRLEGLIGYDFDLDFLSRKLGLRDTLKKASVRLDSVDDGIVCFKGARTEAFRKHLKNRLAQIRQSGWLDAAFSDYR